MDGMTAKEFLLQPARARVRLEMALLRRDALKSLTERVTQTFGIQTPGVHTQNYSAMEDAVIRLTEAEEMVERRMEELAKAELKVGDVLARLCDEKLFGFMVRRFLNCMSREEAAKEMNYTYRWGWYEEQKGIEEVQRILDEKDCQQKDKKYGLSVRK